jgi:hypothetical protein
MIMAMSPKKVGYESPLEDNTSQKLRKNGNMDDNPPLIELCFLSIIPLKQPEVVRAIPGPSSRRNGYKLNLVFQSVRFCSIPTVSQAPSLLQITSDLLSLG